MLEMPLSAPCHVLEGQPLQASFGLSRALMCHPAYSYGHLPFWLVSAPVASRSLTASDTPSPLGATLRWVVGILFVKHIYKPADTLTYSFGFSINVRQQPNTHSPQTPPDKLRCQITPLLGNIKETNKCAGKHIYQGSGGVNPFSKAPMGQLQTVIDARGRNSEWLPQQLPTVVAIETAQYPKKKGNQDLADAVLALKYQIYFNKLYRSANSLFSTLRQWKTLWDAYGCQHIMLLETCIKWLYCWPTAVWILCVLYMRDILLYKC